MSSHLCTSVSGLLVAHSPPSKARCFNIVTLSDGCPATKYRLPEQKKAKWSMSLRGGTVGMPSYGKSMVAICALARRYNVVQ